MSKNSLFPRFSFNISFIMAVMAAALLPLSVSTKVEAALPSEVTGYEESADGEVWTIKEYVQEQDRHIANPSCWYEEGTKVEFDTTPLKETLEEWQHLYSYDRDSGIAPISYWKVHHRPAECIHGTVEDSPIEDFHDVADVAGVCHLNYYSGWMPYCADCDTVLVNGLHYLSKNTASQITELDMSKGYYYNCQVCGNLEQGFDRFVHSCDGVSTNQYAVIYDKNTDETVGKMNPSLHMYNNDYYFEGKMIIPQMRLNLCTFQRTGYVFTGWNSKPDGSGISYEDGAEIYNLTVEINGEIPKNYDKNNVVEGSYVTLYAQWERVRTTLIIDAGNGYYDGQLGQTELVQDYDTSYTVNESLFKAGKGFKVSFNSNGGGNVDAIQKDNIYKGYATGGSLNGRMAGRMKGNTYYFIGPVGTVDRIVALWEQPSITLPSVSKEGYSFGGWYLDSACTKPVGTGGDSFVPTSDCTLYAKWVTLILTATDNYEDYNGSGAVDLEWSMPNAEGNAYTVSQSIDGVTFERISDAADIVNPTESSIDGTYEYTGAIKRIQVPLSGYYEVEVSGASGEDYIVTDYLTGEETEYKGGKGSKVKAKFYFHKDEWLTLTVGGSEGWNSGGDGGEHGGNGGGFSGIHSNIQGWLVKAGGGGGASLAGEGGNADGGVAYTADSNGEDGNAGGGGGGHLGGLAGVYEEHFHTDDCYLSRHEEHTTFEMTPDSNANNVKYSVQDAWAKTWQGYTDLGDRHIKYTNAYIASLKGDWYSMYFLSEKTNSVEAGLGLTAISGPLFIPTYGYEEAILTIQTGYMNFVLSDGRRMKNLTNSYVECFDQNGELIGRKDFKEDLLETESNSLVAGEANIAKDVRFEIPEGTTGIYFNYKMEVEGPGNSNDSGRGIVVFQKLMFKTDREEIICGHEEGELISKQPSTGGSSKVFGSSISHTIESGVNAGNGKITIKAKDVGYQETTSLEGVKATDVTPPEKVENLKIEYARSNMEKVIVSYAKVKDQGTTYYHKVDAYLKTTGSYLTTSNITKNTLTTGIEGYYYLIDNNSEIDIDETNFNNTNKVNIEEIELPLKENVQYLHIIAKDRAGNFGKTVHLKIPGTVEDSEELEGFKLEAMIYRILSPHEPKFKKGESGEVQIVVKGYAERVEVLFPNQLGNGKLQLFQKFHYDGIGFKHEEVIPFQIPLYMEEGVYEVKVWAYKGEEVMEANPEFLTITVQGSVLDEVRTRVRQ